MTQKEQIKSPIKQRILQFIDSIGISKRSFYSKTGISRGTLDNNAGITEDTITKLFAIYENINPFWLITGNGEMLQAKDEEKQETQVYSRVKPTLDKEDELLRLQRECYEKGNRIISLLDENTALRKELEEIKKATE